MEGKSETSRLILGTAQLGMDYGVANVNGQPDMNHAIRIVAAAWEGGICELDTATVYGQSEEVIGRILQALKLTERMRVSSKLPPDFSPDQTPQPAALVSQSLERLSVSKLSVLFLHREELLDQWNDGLADQLQVCIRQGLVDQIGISVYSPERALQAFQCPGLDVVQLPANLFDKRFFKAGCFDSAEKNQINIYLRSVFLQGLFFLNPFQLPQQMLFCRKPLQLLHDFCSEYAVGIHALALSYVKIRYPQSRVIIGAETVEQVQENLRIWSDPISAEVINAFENNFSGVEEQVLNPMKWPC